jgi:hypothetical protein
MAEETLARWNETDWGAGPHIFMDAEPEIRGQEWGTAGRHARLSTIFRGALRKALAAGGAEDDWLLFLQDDLEFHPRIGSLVESWPALEDIRCGVASLFNPSLQAFHLWGEMERAFAAQPGTFLGAQALLLRRWAAELAAAEWDTVPGMQSQRLARLLGMLGPIWVHRPSLVQHVAKDSSWGARINRALDYDPSFRE